MTSSGITPLDLKVLVLPDVVEERTAGGILLPDAIKDKQKFSTVNAVLVAVGPNAFREWGADNAPTPGSRIVVAQYAGSRVKGQDGKEYVLMNDEDVIAGLAEVSQ